MTARLELPTTIATRRADGIVELRDRPRARVELADAKAVLAAVRELSPRLPCPVLVVPGTTEEVTRQARAHFSQSDEAAEVVSRVAFLIDSPLSRVIAAVFVGLQRPRYPSAAFATEAEAVAWLLSA